MEIRPATTRDIRQLAELWARAFPGERTVEQRVRQMEAGGVYGGIETAWIATDDADRTVGGFRSYALQQHLHGGIVPILGLAAVAVDSGARRRGTGAELCRTALRHAYARGDVLSVLYPFRPSYYEALGWALCGSLHSCMFRPESLPVTHDNPRVQEITDAASIIAPCYDRFAQRSNGLLVRSQRIWQHHLDWPDLHVLALIDAGVCRGYVLACLSDGDEGGADDETVLTVREMIASDDDAYAEILSWLSLQRSRVYYITYDARPDEHFDLRLIEPRTPGIGVARTLFAETARVIRGPMARLVNVRSAIEGRISWPVDDGAFTLSITDEIIAENNGRMHVEITGGRASIVTEPRDATAAIDTDIGTFTQIFLGELSVTDATQFGRAHVHFPSSDSMETKRLDAIFRTEPAFLLLDEF